MFLCTLLPAFPVEISFLDLSTKPIPNSVCWYIISLAKGVENDDTASYISDDYQVESCGFLNFSELRNGYSSLYLSSSGLGLQCGSSVNPLSVAVDML